MNWEIFLRDALGMKKSMFFKNRPVEAHMVLYLTVPFWFSPDIQVSSLVKIGLSAFA